MSEGLWARVADLFDPPPSPYENDPVKWVEERAGEYLWSKQREIAEALLTHRKVAVKAGHGVGKSFVSSRIGAWWVDTNPPQETWLITTAPTHDQVAGILWQELAIAHEKAGLAGQITGDCRWRIGKTMVGQGRKPANYSQHAFQGLHRRKVLVILDEACGVVGNIWEGASNIVTGPECRTLAIGNPDDPNSEFARICRGAPTDGTSGMSDAGWYVIRISVFDTPTFTGEDVPETVRYATGSREYVEDKRREVGEGSALWTSKILGEFPVDASDGVIPYSLLAAARIERELAPEALLPVHLGIDVGASDEGDQTVIRERRGSRLGRVWRYREKDHIKLAQHILRHIDETGATSVKLDAGGVGHGLVDILTAWRREARHQAEIVGVQFGGAATNPQRFINARAEMYWGLRELLQSLALDFSVIEDGTVQELAAPEWMEDTTGRIKLLPKSEITARLSRSPDDGDAVALAFYEPTASEPDGYFWIEE